MPKKFSSTATGGKRKLTPRGKNDSQLKEDDRTHLDTLCKEKPRRKRRKTTALTIYSRTSKQTSTCNQFPGGRLPKLKRSLSLNDLTIYNRASAQASLHASTSNQFLEGIFTKI